ncbi:MoxR family ATPase [Candidatus Woesearchaeota archaeon]|jgi:MoxR-like ATPase|nr:MoxR family ATPase [Candidatus Woesearchaeota archaeon]MBT4368189.1 MoxR family ATPase [Candidatus Woesearchaeota archaeon]MBT4712677.1 MoxR family ATPase [Candidatus Woesearchaeota archaeon]MBT6639590.1 MoxR family ATPase [Candidatus Woesearchaeota archaeon]MBT7133762.1 MoxR family ATPase [Candidatus Woesearchaeota archaeon]
MTTHHKEMFDHVTKELHKVVIGQNEMIEEVIIALLCNGNALLEGYPGLAKTLTINTLSKVIDLKFSRIQNTPDLMPSDITGTYIINEERGKRSFKFQPGPIFANIVLADEINRATPKSQSAFLEAMQEKQVTVGTSTFKLEDPFFVLATQNPIEQEGTYPLPEAQADRFLLKIKMGYPNEDEEIQIVKQYTEKETVVEPKKVMDKARLLKLQELTKNMPIADDLRKAAVKIVIATRKNKELFMFGASPRASMALILASKARALIKGRTHVSGEDIKTMALPVLRHRVVLSFEAERQGLDVDAAISKIIK